MLIFAHKSTHVIWYLMIFALNRSSHVCWYLPKDLCMSADIYTKIFAHLPIFAHSRSLHVCWYLPKDLCMSADIYTNIFAHLPIFAHSRSLRVCWYLPKDLGTYSNICPQQIFERRLIFAHIRSFYVFCICLQQISARHFNANIPPKCWITCLLCAFTTFEWVFSQF